jgi:hypothetical protein
MLSLEMIQQRFAQAQLAGHIYQHNQILVLQEPFTESGSALNIFLQHELTADQIGLQFAIERTDNKIRFLIGVTHSNQDHRTEISIGHLKGNQKAFNLCYAFYNYPKHFYVIETDLYVNAEQFNQCLEEQLFIRPELSFLNTATKINPKGQAYPWMKHYIAQLCLDMKVRIQTCLL